MTDFLEHLLPNLLLTKPLARKIQQRVFSEIIFLINCVNFRKKKKNQKIVLFNAG